MNKNDQLISNMIDMFAELCKVPAQLTPEWFRVYVKWDEIKVQTTQSIYVFRETAWNQTAIYKVGKHGIICLWDSEKAYR